jgi:hypothetical protein
MTVLVTILVTTAIYGTLLALLSRRLLKRLQGKPEVLKAASDLVLAGLLKPTSTDNEPQESPPSSPFWDALQSSTANGDATPPLRPK